MLLWLDWQQYNLKSLLVLLFLVSALVSHIINYKSKWNNLHACFMAGAWFPLFVFNTQADSYVLIARTSYFHINTPLILEGAVVDLGWNFLIRMIIFSHYNGMLAWHPKTSGTEKEKETWLKLLFRGWCLGFWLCSGIKVEVVSWVLIGYVCM